MSSDVIDNLYHAFRKVPQPLKIDGCTQCCTSDAELKALEKGVRGAPIFAVRTLAHDGISTVGNEGDYKYFLPRILHEMFLDDEFYDLCIDALTTWIKKAGFDNWTREEKEVTLSALLAIFEEHCDGLDVIDTMDWLYGIACVDFDVSGFLGVLDRPEHKCLKLKLVLEYLVEIRSKENETVKFWHGYLTYQQYSAIYQWVALQF